jgi:hypothetical protein
MSRIKVTVERIDGYCLACPEGALQLGPNRRADFDSGRRRQLAVGHIFGVRRVVYVIWRWD